MGYKRARERNKRLKKLYDESCHLYGSGGAYYSDKKKRYIQYSYSSNSKYPKTLKNHANRRFRRVREEEASLPPAHYKRYYDYWWNLL